MIKYTNAKKIVDFYIEQLDKDKFNPQAQYSMQLAQLKLMRYKVECLQDGLTAYDIEVDNG